MQGEVERGRQVGFHGDNGETGRKQIRFTNERIAHHMNVEKSFAHREGCLHQFSTGCTEILTEYTST